ncbi:DUF3226 domain-containing protein [Brevifollis gellanilyticus]|uniref:DUF4276 family protein n=1 Tax=Brevifollis gellanilyticus TaxID=748831 RepID=A0A512MHS0_9BACT|nr:DUF3226 domain-containing protein [Brevifollis gellanilyticus]GEP46274.1 hypothetical protein BGE01nite_55650 [Brevifollis gellanilyticus]
MATTRRPLILAQPNLLLCEGEDEVNFFSAWFSELGWSDIQIIAYQGKTKLAEFLADLSKLPGTDKVKKVAITRDADEDADSALTSVRHLIEQSSEWLLNLQPSVFVLPGGGKSGALESLWLASLLDDPKAVCVEEFFRCIREKGWEPSEVFAKNDKARAQLWIAMKDIPNERFGIAALHGRKDVEKPWMKEKWVDFDHPAFDSLRQFLISSFR